MLTLSWGLGQEVGMLPGRFWEAHRCLLEHSPLLPAQLRTALRVLTAPNQTQNFPAQH